MRMPRVPIARLMAIVAILALDFAALRATLPRIPNLGLVVMVVVLEVVLLSPATRRAPGRSFWLGFQAVGWAYVLAGFAWNRPLWAFDRSLFEGSILGAKITQPGDMNRFLLLAGVWHLVGSLAAALLGGLVASQVARIRRGRPLDTKIAVPAANPSVS